MTSPVLDFDEKAFIDSVIDRYLNNDGNYETNDDIFEECFNSKFPTEEICEAIRLKFYPAENYDAMTLHSILYNKVDDAFYEEEDSNADTEEFESEELSIIDDYDDY